MQENVPTTLVLQSFFSFSQCQTLTISEIPPSSQNAAAVSITALQRKHENLRTQIPSERNINS